MKKFKKYLALFLVLCMVAAMLPAPAAAYDMGKVGIGQTISAGDYHSLAIKADGTLWGWGRNSEGQLGDGTTKGHHTPVKIMDNVIAVSAGSQYSLAIKADGTLWAWGDNRKGQLGDGTTEERHTPVKIMDNVAAVSAGHDHSLAIKNDGTLWAWGDNRSGQLGDGTTEDCYTPVKIMDNVAMASAEVWSTIAIKTDGTFWAAGSFNIPDDPYSSGNFHGYTTLSKLMDDVTAGFEGIVIKSNNSLWTWGDNNYGQLGDGTTEVRHAPIKIMDNAIALSSTGARHFAIKADGTLWAWGDNNLGELGDGTTENRYTPVKIMENVASVSAGAMHGLAVKSDGSLWAWGENSWSELGDGTTEDCLTPIKIMDNVKLPGGAAPATPSPTSSEEEYIYDVLDPGEDTSLDVGRLDQVTDTASAVSAVKDQLAAMTGEQKQSATGVDLATLYAESAASKVSSVDFEGGELTLDAATVGEVSQAASQTLSELEQTLQQGGVTVEREMFSTVLFQTESTDLTIHVNPDVLTSGVDKVRVETPSFALTFKLSDLAPDLTESLTFTAHGVFQGATAAELGERTLRASSLRPLELAGELSGVAVELPRGSTTNPVTVSLPSGTGDKAYQAVANTQGETTASKYNPATGKLDGKINVSGTYSRVENKKDFTDIFNKSAEMQKAIRYLASKGIITGTGDGTTFSPNNGISRAEVSQLLVKALGKMNSSASANFKDVTRKDWFYSAAASSQKYGIINGYDDNTFRGKINIPKDQILAVSARVLKNEMGYKMPSDPTKYLSQFKDTVATWAQPEVALATRENLVVKRTDGTFSGTKTMTRGDAAIIIYRLFQKIW